MKTFFITGTDTEVGKTYSTAFLLRYLKQKQKQTIALKPIASGCEQSIQGLRNADALTLQKEATLKLQYDTVNPFAFEEAIAPHVACGDLKLSAQLLFEACEARKHYSADYCLIEGAGGWLTPLNETETLADLVRLLDCPALLVVGVRLGCLNHAMLTVESILSNGIKLAGWIANYIDPNMPKRDHSIAYLKKSISAPCLAEIGYRQSDINPKDSSLLHLL